MGVKAWIIMVNLTVLRINDRLDTIISNHELEWMLELGMNFIWENRQTCCQQFPNNQ